MPTERPAVPIENPGILTQKATITLNNCLFGKHMCIQLSQKVVDAFSEFRSQDGRKISLGVFSLMTELFFYSVDGLRTVSGFQNEEVVKKIFDNYLSHLTNKSNLGEDVENLETYGESIIRDIQNGKGNAFAEKGNRELYLYPIINSIERVKKKSVRFNLDCLQGAKLPKLDEGKKGFISMPDLSQAKSKEEPQGTSYPSSPDLMSHYEMLGQSRNPEKYCTYTLGNQKISISDLDHFDAAWRLFKVGRELAQEVALIASGLLRRSNAGLAWERENYLKVAEAEIKRAYAILIIACRFLLDYLSPGHQKIPIRELVARCGIFEGILLAKFQHDQVVKYGAKFKNHKGEECMGYVGEKFFYQENAKYLAIVEKTIHSAFNDLEATIANGRRRSLLEIEEHLLHVSPDNNFLFRVDPKTGVLLRRKNISNPNSNEYIENWSVRETFQEAYLETGCALYSFACLVGSFLFCLNGVKISEKFQQEVESLIGSIVPSDEIKKIFVKSKTVEEVFGSIYKYFKNPHDSNNNAYENNYSNQRRLSR